jgi:hypothetical protein
VELDLMIPKQGTIADALLNPSVLGQTFAVSMLDKTPAESGIEFIPES